MKKSISPESFMRMALRLAEKGMGSASPNPMVGAVMVKNGVVIGKGFHAFPGGLHAEIEALRSRGKKRTEGAELFVTLEPCSSWGRTPPCTDAIIASGIGKVYIGCADPNPKHAGRGIKILRNAGIETECFVLERECRRLNEAFFKWIACKRPFVLLKLAETLDGKIADFSGKSQWITSEKARSRVRKLRLWADAVMCGRGTFEADSPRFTARDADGRVLKTPRRFVAAGDVGKLAPLPEGWEGVSLKTPEKWRTFLKRLGTEQVTSLLLEGGGELAASALDAGVVDKVEFHIAPKILGGRDSRPSVGGEARSLSEALELENVTIERCAPDLIVSGYTGKICLQD